MGKIVATGASGFVGKHLIKRLKEEKGDKVVCFDRKKHSFLDIESLKDLVKEASVIYHLAAVNKSDDPNLFPVNVVGTENLLSAVFQVAPKAKFIFASSFAVYRTPQREEIIKEEFEKAPRNKYGLSKFLGEEVVEYYRRLGVNARILRISNIYGPGMKPFAHSVVATFFELIKSGKELIIDGDGSQTRDFVYVEDVINALKEASRTKKNFSVINICSGDSVSVNDLVHLIEVASGRKTEVNYREADISSIGFWKGDFSLAKKLLKWEPETSLKEWLSKLV